MRREEFMRQLEALLSDISEEERREALAYYQSYFEDAGEENEERILRELESPQKVAQTIKEDLKMEQGNQAGAYTEYGYEDGRSREGTDGNYWLKADRRQNDNRREEDRTIKIALIVIVAVLTSPIWGSIVFSVFGTVVGTAVAFVVGAFALYVCGGVLFGIGIGEIAAGSGAVGFGLMGAAMFVWVIAVLMTIFCVWICGKGIPWLCDVVSILWRKVFPRKEQAL